MNPLDAIALTIPGLHQVEDREGVRVWHTPEGDAVGLFYFAMAPDLPGGLDAFAELQLALSQHVSASGAALVEATLTVAGGCRALRQCIKSPQQPSGMTYLGSLTLPFRDFSFVLKIQCEEHGISGLREAALIAEKLECGEIQLDPDGVGIAGWMRDPYDAARTSGLARTLADDEAYDQRFPEHPLSRARRFLKTAEASVSLSDSIKTAPAFIYRIPAPGNKPWWKIF